MAKDLLEAEEREALRIWQDMDEEGREGESTWKGKEGRDEPDSEIELFVLESVGENPTNENLPFPFRPQRTGSEREETGSSQMSEILSVV